MYGSTLLPTTNEPDEIRRALLDLLAKVNQNANDLTAEIAGLETKSNRVNTSTVGYFNSVDCASGGQVTLPTGGTFEWFVATYGATYNSVKAGISIGGVMAGTASANLTIYYKRLT